MDSSIKSPVDSSELLGQNGLHGEFPDSGKNGVVLDAVEANAASAMIKEKGAPNGSIENLDNHGGDATYVEEMEKGPNVNEQSDLVVSMVKEVKNMDLKKSKSSRVIPKIKNEKPLSPRNVSSSLMKNKKDGNVEGPSALSQPKQQIKSKSIVDKNIQLSKSSVKTDAASSKVDSSKLKHLKKEPDDTVGGTETTDLNAEDATPHRIGRLPNYGFSFKCDERAEKRREFYSKLEEKFHAKEVEKSNLQAKTKETQEAEIKMLRKSLTFKATPMPSFYQEPPPPKMELKKIPLTRAKSPKLGRRKSFTSAEAQENASGNTRPDRLSLDEKISQNNSVKGISPVHVKKPQRKSLPRLPSERSAVSSPKGTGKGHLAKVTNDNIKISNSTHEERSISPVQSTEENGDFTEPHEEKISTSINQDASANEMLPAVVALDIPSERESYTNGEKDFEEPTQPALVQEYIGGDN